MFDNKPGTKRYYRRIVEYQSRIELNNRKNVGYIPRFSSRMLRFSQIPSWVLLGVMWLLVYLPRSFSNVIGSMLGDMYRISGKKRLKVVETNLRLCFPELTSEERTLVAKKHFRVYGQALLDSAVVWWASERFLERFVRFKGLEHYQSAIDQGHAVILLTGHFVAIDIGGPVISRHHKQIGMIKPVYNEVLDWALGKGRIRFGSRMLLRDQGMRQVIRSLKEGYGFSYVPDEDFGPEKSVFVPFLGTQAPTLTSVSKLANIANAKVLPCFVWRLPSTDGYLVEMMPALENFPSGNNVADAAIVRRVLSTAVRQHPDQYMWTFKFFSSQPEGRPSPYEP